MTPVTRLFALLNTLHFIAAQTQSQGRPKVYACPGDNGIQYTTPNPRVTFELKCGQGTTAKRIDDTPKNSQKECADFCAELPNCQSCDWNINTKNCARFSEYIPTIPMTGVNTWFPLYKRDVPPPTPPRPDAEPRTPPNCPKPYTAIIESQNVTSFTADPECAAADKKTFVTPGGSYYYILCATTSSGTEIGKLPKHDFGECLTACSETPGCASVTWSGGRPTWDCTFYSSNGDARIADATAKKDFGYLIDPPVSDKPDDLTVTCSTDCPAANGQTWEAQNGIKFHMDCCKRHGVTPIAYDQQPSFTACMATCASVLGCGSDDWHQETGKCWYGKHFGEPTISASGWSSAHSLGCAGGCKKAATAACSTCPPA